MTIPDVALPAFAFSMGASSAISMSRHKLSFKKVFRRTIIMFAIGITLNILPILFQKIFFNSFEIQEFFDEIVKHGRLFGIIQRLALTYAFGILIARRINSRLKILGISFVLLGISSLGFHLYSPQNPFDELNNISQAVDYIFPGSQHIYTLTHDPEGLYGTISGTASVLFGFYSGRIFVSNSTETEKVFRLFFVGSLLLILGGLWSNVDIISKKMWTSPFALINAGGDMMFLAMISKIFDNLKCTTKFFHPLKILGQNPLFFFVANNVIVMILCFVPYPSADVGLYLWIYQHTTQGIISPSFGSMLFCILWLLAWLPIAQFFYHSNIKIKI